MGIFLKNPSHINTQAETARQTENNKGGTGDERENKEEWGNGQTKEDPQQQQQQQQQQQIKQNY